MAAGFVERNSCSAPLIVNKGTHDIAAAKPGAAAAAVAASSIAVVVHTTHQAAAFAAAFADQTCSRSWVRCKQGEHTCW